MPLYCATVYEVVTLTRARLYEADTLEAATDAAEASDWHEWDIVSDHAECTLDSVELCEPDDPRVLRFTPNPQPKEPR